MAYGDEDRSRDKVKSAIVVVLICALVAWGLFSGIRTDFTRSLDETIDLITLNKPAPPPQPPLPPPEPEKSAPKKPEGAAAPENIKSKATQVVVPKPKIVLKTKNDTKVAEKAGTGNDSTQGASDKAGLGTGAGGVGSGTGSGASGSGDGGGGSGGSPARKIAGELRTKDYPKARRDERNGKSVGVRFTVQPTGRATGCRVIRSSGNAEDDTITCRLIEQKFRYQPAHNANGTPIASQQQWFQRWWLEPRG